MAVAYLDKSGVLHIVNQDVTIDEANTFTVPTNHPHEGGYPTVDGEQIVYYSDDNKAYAHGNRKSGHEIPVPDSIRSLLQEFE